MGSEATAAVAAPGVVSFVFSRIVLNYKLHVCGLLRVGLDRSDPPALRFLFPCHRVIGKSDPMEDTCGLRLKYARGSRWQASSPLYPLVPTHNTKKVLILLSTKGANSLGPMAARDTQDSAALVQTGRV